MTIKISLTNFKCWNKKTVEIPDNGLTLLSGKSGAGKTGNLYSRFRRISSD